MTPRTHVFAVAVESYLDSNIKPVVFVENDAREFMKAWQSLGIQTTDCALLLSGAATFKAFETKLKTFLSNVVDGDRVVFFFAGHGLAIHGESRITVHDTQLGDLPNTTLSINKILLQVDASKSTQSILFLDTRHRGLPIPSEMRSICGNFSTNELEEFCEDSEHHSAFTSCKVEESSYSAATLSHGVWTYCVINALRGEAKDALERGNLVTRGSLQTYLLDEVPRTLRKTMAGSVTQTPCSFGNFTKELVVADVGPILAAKADTLGSLLKDSSLRGASGGQIRHLSGFQKNHRVPDGHFNAAKQFVTQVGHENVKSQAEKIAAGLKNAFSYKFKDIHFACEDGAATIKTPDFDVNVWIEQDKANSADYLLTTDVTAIRRQAVVMEDKFSDVFSPYCDTVVIELSQAIDVGEKIGQIEDIQELAEHLEYSADGETLTLSLPGDGIRFGLTAHQMTIGRLGGGTLQTFLINAQKSLTKLGAAGVFLVLPEKTSP